MTNKFSAFCLYLAIWERKSAIVFPVFWRFTTSFLLALHPSSLHQVSKHWQILVGLNIVAGRLRHSVVISACPLRGNAVNTFGVERDYSPESNESSECRRFPLCIFCGTMIAGVVINFFGNGWSASVSAWRAGCLFP
jgi:hypothetical protein